MRHLKGSELVAKLAEKLAREALARTDAASVAQCTGGVVLADKQRAHAYAGRCKAADDEWLRAQALRLQPISTSTRRVPRAAPLRHDAFDTEGARVCENVWAVADKVRHVEHDAAFSCGREKFFKEAFTFFQRQPRCVSPIEMMDVERIKYDARP